MGGCGGSISAWPAATASSSDGWCARWNCRWHAPSAHDLETWGDARAWDGTVSLLQPLIESWIPVWTPAMAIAVLRGNAAPEPRALLEGHWRSRLGARFDAEWRRALLAGVLAQGVTVEPGPVASAPPASSQAGSADGLELEFLPDPTVWDGRHAFNPWLQETPKPVSQIVWENAAYVSPATAASLGLAARDEVELRYRGRVALAPVWILPGQCDRVITIHLGYGRPWPGPRGWLDGDGSLPVGGGWRLYLGRSVGTERRTMNGGNESTRTRTFGVGRGATISSAHGNAVFAKGWAVQSWRSATHWGSGQGTTGQFRGKTVTVGSNTRAQVRSGARPLTREERKVLKPRAQHASTSNSAQLFEQSVAARVLRGASRPEYRREPAASLRAVRSGGALCLLSGGPENRRFRRSQSRSPAWAKSRHGHGHRADIAKGIQ